MGKGGAGVGGGWGGGGGHVNGAMDGQLISCAHMLLIRTINECLN